ncbi:MAG: MSEP-CTERM sorting domain-containing protein, partial [Ginsengibacter sp.]
MRNLLNPKWLFIINTLPIIVLFILFYGQFNIIKTLLDEDTIYLWKCFSWILGILGLLNFAYAIFLTSKKQLVSVWYGIIALLLYIPIIYVYYFNADKIIPFSVPQWMISGNIFFYVGTFLMPTLAYSIFILIAQLTPPNKEQTAWKNFLIAIAIPVLGYLFSQIAFPLWRHVNSNYVLHGSLILIIVATLVFLFFLVRGIYIVATKKAVLWQKYQLAWKIPIAIVLPLLGLAVNNGYLLGGLGNDRTIFGDFNQFWFYALAVVNGILLCLPNTDNKLYRLILFIARSITFAFTFYFFMVFL